jgi:Na+(H+)/acetate symporter ActP
MMGWNVWALSGIAMIAVVTFSVGVWGSRAAHTTSDFLVARRLVREERNAAAISGEYLSAASFLGIAGLVLKDGVDALWYPIGFASGYLALMLFVAAPLRRSGAYTLPDFAEARLNSLPLRWLATLLVVVIGWLYLVPQLQGAGLTLSTITGLPYATGVIGVAVIVLASVLSGGMRAVTLVQAFQYWVKLFAISVPAFVLFLVFLTGNGQLRNEMDTPAPPKFEHDTTVRIDTDVQLRVAAPMWLQVSGSSGKGVFGNGSVYVRPGEYPVSAGTQLRFPAGAPTPVVSDAEPDNASWIRPQQHGIRGLFQTYSLILATFLGTMGLPHVLVRFYTNPSGPGARRTAMFVLGLLGTFYLFPTIFGLLSRLYVPQLLVTGKTDAAVLLLPGAMLGNWVGGLLGAITAAGAFAAFLSTSSGLVVTVAGVLSTDVLRGRVSAFRSVSLAAAAVPTALALSETQPDISQSVALAFAMAASTFCPLLVLGIWWRGLTAVGAISGLVTGASLVLVAVGLGAVTGNSGDWWSVIVHQPAVITVPCAFLVTYVVSRATSGRVPDDVSRVMLRMHAPDRLGFVEDRMIKRFGILGSKRLTRASATEGRHHR